MTSHNNHRSRNASPQFHSIKAVFEHADVPNPRPFSRGSKPSSPANETPNPVASPISKETLVHQQDNIDALLEDEAPPASASASAPHPSSALWLPTPPDRQLRHKSSWIGPEPALTSHTSSKGSNAAMARKVTISYSSPGLQPPVYITASLSEPQWALLEMDCTELPGGERHFAKTFHVADGEYQYKFRLGPGDWWVCDEEKPTVDDGFGARNNVLVVKGDVPARESVYDEVMEPIDCTDMHGSPTLPHERDLKRDGHGHDASTHAPKVEHYDEHHAPLLAHEQNGSPAAKLGVPPETIPVNFSRQDTLALGCDDDDDDGNAEPSHFPEAPTFDHERHEDLRTPTPGLEDDEDQPPLMRHETLSPVVEHSEHHRGLNSNNDVSSPTSSHSSSHWPTPASHIPQEADPNDPSLERFPTHHEGIISSLRRASLRMAASEEEGKDDEVLASTSSPIAKSVSHSSQSPSLPSVLENEEELAEEEPAEKPLQQVHALATGLPHARPAALMTPPRTPEESKAPQTASAHSLGHHHNPPAEKDMHEEAKHDVKHHEAHDQQHQQMNVSEPPSSSSPKVSKKEAAAASDKAPRSGFFETALGLGLFVVVGVGAAWLAFMMQDPIKDGGAALSGVS